MLFSVLRVLSKKSVINQYDCMEFVVINVFLYALLNSSFLCFLYSGAHFIPFWPFSKDGPKIIYGTLVGIVTMGSYVFVIRSVVHGLKIYSLIHPAGFSTVGGAIVYIYIQEKVGVLFIEWLIKLARPPPAAPNQPPPPPLR